ncbi:MAG: hypothetical protein RM022_002240 [Nostoc sp. EfeVER01]|uniref:hypothetical protein n=1 Tax=Nostoc sp. EfeVER01 TaxID=3075406 RepID=UPI002AD47E0A|nr:hypothetical protein [Nostoc sp. EfeVER01]MDZ7947738.1 hypothetical protein [Nostoc sp. EfeVER01]
MSAQIGLKGKQFSVSVWDHSTILGKLSATSSPIQYLYYRLKPRVANITDIRRSLLQTSRIEIIRLKLGNENDYAANSN